MEFHSAVKSVAVAGALLTLAACQPAGPSAQEMEAAAAVGGAWAEHYNAGNADAVADLYWEDAAFMVPGGPALVGRDAIRSLIAAGIEADKAAGLTQTNASGPAHVSGNIAWQEGTFSVIDASGAVAYTGKYLSVLEKRDGSWRLLRDIYNLNGAPPAATADPDAVAADPQP